jgi:glutamate synthase (NADPH/NADH) small chain
MVNKNIAIIGSGPAGLICANQLKSFGLSVTVFDELSEFGGMIAYGIPEFRIPLSAIREKIELAKKNGITFQKKKITSVKKLLKSNKGEFDFVVIAIGAGKGSTSGTKGEETPLVIDGLEFLLKLKLEGKKLVFSGEKVAVIGGGNSAMDAARSINRIGAKATVIYRRTALEMPALKSEIEGAKADGVEFEFLKNPIEYRSTKNSAGKEILEVICSKMMLGTVDTSGRRKPIDSGQTISYKFDKVILAIGQKQNFGWIEKEGIKNDGKIILVDDKNKTNLENVFAAGDAVMGAKTIKDATLSGIKTAKSILEII